MQVGLVVPTEGLVSLGGAGRSWRALYEALSETYGVEAVLIDASAEESDAPTTLDDYARFSDLDVSGVDVVIATKYPAWMVHHPRVSVWMYHPLRGLYDLYPGGSDDFVGTISPLLEAAATSGDAEAIREIAAFVRLHPDDPQHGFPGPLIRSLVHQMDHGALRRAAVVATLSRTVAARDGYFPPGVIPRPLMHPCSLDVAAGETVANRLFTASRFDQMKRIDLIIDAVLHSDRDVRLRIAGGGPQRAELEKRAAGDPRVAFLGVISDEELSREYVAASAVPFVPFDEDFGLVTIEAWAHGTPVITTSDSGGVAELVVDGVSGLVVEPQMEALSAACDDALTHAERTASYGEIGRQVALSARWDRVVSRLAGPTPRRWRARHNITARGPRSRVVVVSGEEVSPGRHGGQIRARSLYSNLSEDVRFVSLGTPNSTAGVLDLGRGASEVVVPRSRQHARSQSERGVEVGADYVDVLAAELVHLTPDFESCLRKELASADFVVMSQPYLVEVVLDCAPPTSMLIYDAQNIEAKVKDVGSRETPSRIDAHREVIRLEQLAVSGADLVVAVSAEDAEGIVERYGNETPTVVIANGIDVSDVDFVPMGERWARQHRFLNLAGADRAHALGLFLGSNHPPNVVAANSLIAEAVARREYLDASSDVHVLLAGAHARGVDISNAPPSVHSLAVLGTVRKRTVLSSSVFAFNPVTTGSGSNVKVAEYTAAGCSVVTTAFGARGFEHLAEVLHVADAGGILETAGRLSSDASSLARTAIAGRRLVEAHLDWGVLAGQLRSELAPRGTL